jgi:hypothetical protein
MHASPSEDFLIPSLALPPVRGMAPLHNRAGSPFPLPALHRLIRYQCRAFQVRKIDLLAAQPPAPGVMENLLAFAREFQVALSLRTTGDCSPEHLALWRSLGLYDLCLACDAEAPSQEWQAAVKTASLPLRIITPASEALPTNSLERWADVGLRHLTLLSGAQIESASAEEWRETLAQRGIALSMVGVQDPRAVLGLLEEPNPAYFADHNQYQQAAYSYAAESYALSPRALRAKLIFDNLRLSGLETPSDRWLAQFLRNYTPFFTPVQSGLRLARMVGSGADRSIPATASATTQGLPDYFDSIDLARLHETAVLDALAREAHIWTSEAPAQVFESNSWGFENAFHDPLPGVNQMHALLPGERRSTPLPYLKLPFMVSVSFGGGFADSIGFSIGRHIRIVCPMVATAHQLTLYADAAGRYVLLRDGQPTLPVALQGRSYLPPRLPYGAHLQVAVWNPETSLSITALQVWQQAPQPATAAPDFAVSVVVFSTRFSRRLQAVLETVAHQQGVTLSQVECIVGIVPGLDAAEDVLDSLHRVYPELHIEPVMLPASLATAKGFALNECLQRVRAPLTVLLDSDILLPPDFLRAALDAAGAHGFIAPAGRAMLGPEETARILLGARRPWEEFDALAKAAPELRVEENPQEVPLGYCQVFRSEALQHLRYAEYDHFQGADYEFGEALRAHFGGVHRLPRPVLHLDHDTRQWFGAQKQY